MKNLLRNLLLLDVGVFFFWCALSIWFLVPSAADEVFADYRGHTGSLLVHGITTWQLFWMYDEEQRNGGRVRWRPPVRIAIFVFTLILDTFGLVRGIRFVPQTVKAAWICQLTVSACFIASSIVCLIFIGIAHSRCCRERK